MNSFVGHFVMITSTEFLTFSYENNYEISCFLIESVTGKTRILCKWWSWTSHTAKSLWEVLYVPFLFSYTDRPSLVVSKSLVWGSSICSTSGKGSCSLKFCCCPENHVKVIQKSFHCIVWELLNSLWNSLASSQAVLMVTVRRKTCLWNLEGRNRMLGVVFLPLLWGKEELFFV